MLISSLLTSSVEDALFLNGFKFFTVKIFHVAKLSSFLGTLLDFPEAMVTKAVFLFLSQACLSLACRGNTELYGWCCNLSSFPKCLTALRVFR